MTFEPRMLGRSGLVAGRLGVASSYGVPAASVEKAFERGVNYLYWGSRRTAEFRNALRHLAPRRDRYVLVVQSYSRFANLLRWSFERALREIPTDYADVLLLGLWNKPIPLRVMDAARSLRDRGLVRHLAVSAHHRPVVPVFASGGDFDVLHFRYNAVHRGAERDIFPELPPAGGPGLVAYTATNWGGLLNPKRIPAGERVPTAADCYRFVLSRPEVDVCLTGPANAAELDDALQALDRGPMDAIELAWMRRVGDALYK
jgi:aryl-alcohol dehydrogenase-like predicted oxidoreductase